MSLSLFLDLVSKRFRNSTVRQMGHISLPVVAIRYFSIYDTEIPNVLTTVRNARYFKTKPTLNFLVLVVRHGLVRD